MHIGSVWYKCSLLYTQKDAYKTRKIIEWWKERESKNSEIQAYLISLKNMGSQVMRRE